MSNDPFPLPQTLDPFVQELKDALIAEGRWDALDQAVKKALTFQIKQMTDWGITSADNFLRYASGMMKWTPSEDVGGKEIYSVLCLFHFVFDQPPINELQTAIDVKSIGKAQTPLDQWVVAFANNMGAYMNSPASLTPESYQSFVNSPLFNLDEADLPDPNGPTGGFTKFNELFARKLKKGVRPVSGAKDDRVIVYPADSTFDGAWRITADGTVYIHTYEIQTQKLKNIPWPVKELIGTTDYASRYNGGIWMHSFLGPADYHRQHAPVSGRVVEAKVIPGLCYLRVKAQNDSQGNKIVVPHRTYGKTQTDEKGNTFDAPDDAGYQFLQARGWYVKSPFPMCMLLILQSPGHSFPKTIHPTISLLFQECLARAKLRHAASPLIIPSSATSLSFPSECVRYQAWYSK